MCVCWTQSTTKKRVEKIIRRAHPRVSPLFNNCRAIMASGHALHTAVLIYDEMLAYQAMLIPYQ